MQRILSRAKQIKPKHAALFLVAAAAVAAIVYLTGRETQVEQRIEASAPVTQERPTEPPPQVAREAGESTADPLTLTLSAPEICEITHHRDLGVKGAVEVVWTASGGDGEYSVSIAEESYTGASGATEVSCALWREPIADHPKRGWPHADGDKPMVDSGLKTITATATDGSGATVEATADVYVILNAGIGLRILRGGETYRINGTLWTIPQGVDMGIGAMEEISGGEWSRSGTVAIVGIVGSTATIGFWLPEFAEIERQFPISAPGQEAIAAATDVLAADQAFDDLIESFGQPPTIVRSSE